MCLAGSVSATQNYLEENKGKRKVKVYKILEDYRNGKLYSPYWEKEYKPGYNNSNRPLKARLIGYDRDINNGIHVFTTKQAAEEYADLYNYKIVVELTANLEDLVAVSEEGQAVFTRVYLTKKEFARAAK